MAQGHSTKPAEFSEILQTQHEVDTVTGTRLQRLPGVQPLSPTDWICVDSAYDAQMRYRRWLLAQRGQAVLHEGDDTARSAARELLAILVAQLGLRDDFHINGDYVIGPDGIRTAIQTQQPMRSISQLTQADYCVLINGAQGHHLRAAALCFPASWDLHEKFGHPMARIHQPIDEIDAKMDQRIENLFQHLRADQPLWRANELRYADADLHQPRTGAARRDKTAPMRYQRVEFQTLRRLPRSGAIAFGIHTFVTRLKPNG